MSDSRDECLAPEDAACWLVVRANGEERRYPVRPGMTIGRSPDCTVSIDDPDLCWVHACAMGGEEEGDPPFLRCLVHGFTFTLRSGFDHGVVAMTSGTEFSIGENVHMRCEAIDVRPEVVAGNFDAAEPSNEPVVPSLRLTIIHDGQGRVVPVEDGLTIGRSLKCTVPIDDPDLCNVHARVVIDDERRDEPPRMVSEHDVFAFTMTSGRDSKVVALTDGCEFKIGDRVRVRCSRIDASPVPVQPLPQSDVPLGASTADGVAAPPPPPLRVSCPRCREFILHLSADARFCPKCGLTLPECCPPWEFTAGQANPEPYYSGSLLAWLLMRCGHQPVAASSTGTSDVDGIPRPATLVAYINSLFNLGMRCEHGTAAEHNLRQALRYYEKAAKLGSDQAKLRIGVQATTNIDTTA